MRKLPLIILTALVAVAAAAFVYMMQWDAVGNWTPNHRFYVHTTTNTLAHLVEQVGGEDVGVSPIVASNIEPHDYEPTANDVITGLSGDVFVMNGAGLDAWATTIADQREEAGKRIIVALDENARDPHFWLDPLSVINFINQVEQVYEQIDPEYAAQYRANADAYIDELYQLDTEFRSRLVNCEKPEIVVAHDAFNYLGDRYGFEIHPVTGISPDEEPSPSDLANLAQFMKDNNITVVFFEETATDNIAQVLADEANARTEVLYTLEVLPAEETYLSLMRMNLERIADAMVCR
ncbi:MAG: Periplasmic solute binding protein [Candidatus Uhrbacteria bacterium GW2011_GWD2_52_7]|uniref:Periplasmic solute binding protein n=1 Tax=Candidatus Uhrbacteria bacterium GW2011_GWD2_52_7 TaxID=1618989 RepID=A0A0G1XGZ8_9BACT|nr:MAG: Periplasmic solute binding protein [Candidatus Uhrbacteria bacterium GW2011_GWD2_52_7]